MRVLQCYWEVCWRETAIAHAGTGIAHAVGATLGGFYPVEYGKLGGLVLPEAIRYYVPAAKDMYKEVAQLIGLNTEGLLQEAASVKLANAVEGWLTTFGVINRLRDLGVKREMFPAMIDYTSTQNSVGNNIRTVDRKAIESFYEKLY